MQRKVLVIIVVFVISTAVVLFVYLTKMHGTEGAFCGGIAGIECPVGFSCQMEGNYPDASGSCAFDPFNK